jgi:hypothetical protein
MSTMHVSWVKIASGFTGQALNIVRAISSAQAVTTSGTSAQSSAGPTGITNVLVSAVDADLYVAFGSNPTAAPTTGIFVRTGQTHLLEVASGDKIAGIQV